MLCRHQPSTLADVLDGFATHCLNLLLRLFLLKADLLLHKRNLSLSLCSNSRTQDSMALYEFSLCKLCGLFFLLLTCSSKTTPLPNPISDDIFESQALAGRHLLQATQGCPVNFEFLNYTIITSICKGPTYSPKVCCGAFKEFACPYADVLNDLTNDCASTMFSYINLYGKYPPGLFAAECREGKRGLECPALPPSSLANDSSGARITCRAPLLLVLSAGFIILVFQVLFGSRL